MTAAELFVGRDGALAELEQTWASVVRGHPRLVLVSGDAGIGKSTLVARFLDARSDALVLRGGCFGLVSAELPYAPVVQALRPVLDVPEAGPLCAALTGAGEPAGEATRWAQSRLFETTLRLLGGLSRERPVVLALEDVHWADRATLDLLLFLFGNVVTERVLLLLTARCDEPDDPGWLTEALHRLTSARSADVLELTPLGDVDAARLARELGVADDDAARLAERAGGNPLFLTELARGGGAEGLPRRLRDLLLVRLRHVSPAARRVVEVLSAATTPLSPRLLVRALGDDVPDPRAAVTEAFEAHLLAPGGDLLRPGHALLGEAVYAGLPPTERAWLHERIATAVEAEPGLGDASWALAAYHWERADRPDRLPLPLVRAAQAAARCYAFADAARAWQRLLDLDDTTPGVTEAAGLDRAQVLVELAVAARLGAAGVDDIAALREAQGLLAARPERVALTCELLARHHLDRGQVGEAAKAAEAAERAAAGAGPQLRAAVAVSHATVLMVSGQLSEARARCERALALLREEDATERLQALSVLGVTLVAAGEEDAALDAARTAVDIAVEVGSPDAVLRTHVNLVYVLEAVGRYAAAVEAADAALDHAARGALSAVATGPLLGNKASALMALGELEAARDVLRRALARRGPRLQSVYAVLRLAEVEVARGDADRAEALLAGLHADDLAGALVPAQERLVRARLALARGRAGEALRLAGQELAEATDLDPNVGLHLCAVGLRAAALVHRAGGEAAAVAREPAEALAAAAVRLLGDAVLRPCADLQLLCSLEHRELSGGAAPEEWEELAGRFAAGEAALAPYAWMRAAGAHLAGHGRRAASALWRRPGACWRRRATWRCARRSPPSRWHAACRCRARRSPRPQQVVTSHRCPSG